MGIVLKKIPKIQLKAGMVLGETLYDESDNILLAKGIELRHSYIEKILQLTVETVLISDVSKYFFDEPALSGVDPVLNMVNRDMIVSETRQEAESLVKDFMKDLSKTQNVANIDKILIVVNQIIDEILSNDEIAFNLGDLKSVDDYTFEHSVNVCVLSLLTGIMFGLKKVTLVELGIGAILHDIGKILVPQDILGKPGLLDDMEFDTVKRHSRLGYDVLQRIKGIALASAEVALYHHERVDGNGYPNGMSSEEIPFYSKIVAVADVFDALTSDRVYSRHITPYKAVEYIVSMVGAHFDEEIVKRFCRQLGFYYKGLYVKLNTGETAQVMTPNFSRPVVRVLTDSNGIELRHYYEIDIQKNPTVSVMSIVFQHEYEKLLATRGYTG